MCECCWAASISADDYSRTLADHEDRGCVCTKDTPEGRRAKAGQWWDEDTARDKRNSSAGDTK